MVQIKIVPIINKALIVCSTLHTEMIEWTPKSAEIKKETVVSRIFWKNTEGNYYWGAELTGTSQK